jgi:hypothetical protein
MKDQIYRKLIQRYASEQPSVLKEAAYNLSLGSVEVVEADFWNKATQAIGRIKEAQARPNTMLSEAAKKAYSSALAVCPLCKQKMNLVKLLDDRQAFYCQDHKICQPLPVESIGE